MPDLIFVYGTLRSEFDNPYARHLRAEAELLGPATVEGSIFRVAHYPGYLPQPGGTVYGEVYRLRTPEKTLAALDEYEGIEYLRLSVPLSGSGVDVWIYCYAQPLPLERKIESGDFTRL